MAADITTPRTRRALLGAAAGAVGAAVIGGLAAPQRALAAGDDGSPILVGSQFNDVRSLTLLSNTTNNNSVFDASTTGSGTAIYGSSGSGPGVYGQSTSGFGISGYSGSATAVRGDSASGTAVAGHSTSGTGVSGNSGSSTGVSGNSGSSFGVSGTSDSSTGVYGSSNSGTAIYGTSPGYGVYGHSTLGTAVFGFSNSGIGVYGASDSDAVPAVLAQSLGNTGVQAYSGPNLPPASPKKIGVFGSADADAYSVGVRGVSPTGRGGRFKGKKAQIGLDPSTDATHPASGAKGDFFVDSAGRLWFCKGGTTWKQLA
jgi:hypothetical protein